MTAAGPGTPPGPVPSRTWAAWARALCVRSAVPVRRESSSTTIAPTLWRLPAYAGPGLPSPTTSQGPESVTVSEYAAGRTDASGPGP